MEGAREKACKEFDRIGEVDGNASATLIVDMLSDEVDLTGYIVCTC